jgi:LytR cell envelope-related transcriptional attenuator/LytR_cpsA_psr family
MKTHSPMSSLRPPGYRSGRWSDRRRRRRRGVLITVIVLVVLGSLGAIGATYVISQHEATSAPSPSVAAPVEARTRLAVLAVRGSPSLAAVIGSGGSVPAAAVALPTDMTFTVPGQGDGTVSEAADLQGESFRIAVSNLLGLWVDHFGVMDRSDIGPLVDRMGGIVVDVQEPFQAESGSVGPGTIRLTGDEVLSYLDVHGPNLELRWELVLEGLMRTRTALLSSDLLDSDDAPAVIDVVDAAHGAPVQQLPVKSFGGDLQRPLLEVDRDALSGFVSAAFGSDPIEPVPVVVINGSGAPGVGESVAAKIVPAGFRVVLSQNANHFGERTTAIIASGDDHVDEATRVREALDVGEVQVTKVPSGLADVTIVIGKDYGRG